MRSLMLVFVLLMVGMVSAEEYYPYNITSTCSVDSDCSLSPNSSKYTYFVPSFLLNSSGSCFSLSELGIYDPDSFCFLGYGSSIFYSDVDDFFVMNSSVYLNYSSWLVEDSGGYEVWYFSFNDPYGENLSKLYSIEAVCLEGYCAKNFTNLAGDSYVSYGNYDSSYFDYSDYVPPLSDVLDVILGGGSFSEVASAYNPTVCFEVFEKWDEMWEKENFDSFLGNCWDMSVLLIKYMFRQPASLVNTGDL